MSEPESGPSENAADNWPYSPPEHIRYAHHLDGAIPGDDTRPYEEWHHDSALPGESGSWDAPPELEPPPEWTIGGTFMPGNDDPPAWDNPHQDQPARDDPYEPAAYRPASHRQSLRPARRSIAVAVLLAALAAGTGAALAHHATIKPSPAASPEASATGGPGTTASAGHGSTSTRPGAEQPPAITKADAEQVVSRYLHVNNEAHASYSDSLLGTIESGSSYTMDAGSYRFTLGESGRTRTPYVPFELTRTSYYIPRLSKTSYPRWFVARGSYATAGGKRLGSAYIVFARDSAGGPWKDAVEPDILPGRALPQIATGSGGYAESVAADDTGLDVTPGRIRQVTATWLNEIASSTSNSMIKNEAGNLTDLKDEVFWRSGEGGSALDATDTHSVPADPVFALKTTTGGALVFYTTAAQLTLTPPGGGTISGLTIPGYYSPSSSAGLTSATVGYIEQFATYIPAAGNSDRQVVADISSIASRG